MGDGERGRERESKRERGREKSDVNEQGRREEREVEREREAGLLRNYSARRTRGSSQVILALGCRVIYPALLPFLPRLRLESKRDDEGERDTER